MMQVDEQTQAQLDAVRAKCLELDEEHGTDLVKQLNEALDYVNRFGDQELEGKSINKLRPLDSWWKEGDELTIAHFNFGFTATRPTGENWYFVGMHYHNGGRGLPWDSIEVAPQQGPHWSFHS